jgi:integrase
MRLTSAAVRTLTCAPDKTEQVIFDEELPGFGLRVRASGSKTWLVQYAVAGRTRRVFLGSPSLVDVGKARATAKDLLARVRLGGDPAGEKAANRAEAAFTFAALHGRYLERQRARLRPRSLRETVRHLEKHARPLHRHPIASVDRRMIATLLADVAKNSGPVESNATRTSISAFLNWAAREGYVETNAAAHTNKAPANGARARVLTDTELAQIWRAAGDTQYGMVIKLLMLTGARRVEIGGLTWDEIDFDTATATLPPARVKSKRVHVIPLVPAALEILQQRRVQGGVGAMVFGRSADGGFQDWSGSKVDLDQRLAAAGTAIKDWTPHDIRRSISTALNERFGVPPLVVEAILAHVIPGVAGTYNRAIYFDERRRALERWQDHLMAVVTGDKPQAKIHKLRPAR